MADRRLPVLKKSNTVCLYSLLARTAAQLTPVWNRGQIMAVDVIYVVTRKGVRMLETISEAEARAYDKMLDQAEALSPLVAEVLAGAGVQLDERALEDVAIALAKRRDDLLLALGAKRGAKGDDATDKRSERKSRVPAATTSLAAVASDEQAA